MYFLYNNSNINAVSIYIVNDVEQEQRLANELGLSAGEYAVFDNLDALPDGWQTFPNGVTLTLGPTPSYGYALPGAKEQAKTEVKLQNAVEVGIASNNFTAQLLATQSALPIEERIPEVQAVIDDVNVLGAQLQTQLTAIDTATSISDLNDIVNPPAISGQILIDRDSLTLDTTVFVSLTGATPEQMTLYFPATDTTLSYLPLIDGFSSEGADVFATGNYACILKYLGNTIASFDVTTTVPTTYSFATTPTP